MMKNSLNLCPQTEMGYECNENIIYFYNGNVYWKYKI